LTVPNFFMYQIMNITPIGKQKQNWDIIGDGNQLATGNNCLAIQGDAGDIGSRAIIVPCDPKQKSQNWFFAWI